jgi:hypothetical protein
MSVTFPLPRKSATVQVKRILSVEFLPDGLRSARQSWSSRNEPRTSDVTSSVRLYEPACLVQVNVAARMIQEAVDSEVRASGLCGVKALRGAETRRSAFSYL